MLKHLMPGTVVAVLVLAGALLASIGCEGNEPSPGPTAEETREGLPLEFLRMVEVWELLEREHIGRRKPGREGAERRGHQGDAGGPGRPVRGLPERGPV